VGIFALVLGTGCGARDRDEASARAAWASGQEWRAVLEGRIASGADEEGPASFGRISDVTLDAMGRVWVSDALQHEIRIFEPDGHHVRSFGGMGGGPGEFLGIAGMDWAPDGNLWVLDGGNMRFAVYDTVGKLVTTHRRENNSVVSPWPLGFDARGNLYDLVSSSTDREQQIIQYRPSLQPVDTFLLPAFELPAFEVTHTQGNTTKINMVVVPFAGLQQWRMDAEGAVWVGVTDRYRIERHRWDGTIDRVVERDVKPKRVTREQRQRALAGHTDFERKGGRIDASRFPKTLPVFEDFFFDDEGNLWVMITPGRGQPKPADVFDRSGRYLGRVMLPPRFMSSPAPVVRGNRMVGVVQNEDGVESVAVLRLEKPER
jgi:hypothetical protein